MVKDSPPPQQYQSRFLHAAWPIMLAITVLGCVGLLQRELDHRHDRGSIQLEELAHLPKGEYLKPMLLGYHHLGADLLWLRTVQVLGKKHQSAEDFEWIYHALDVITDLDPQYVEPYRTGGLTLSEIAHRVDLGNRLLEKGLARNPNSWWMPFNLGYNYFWHLDDPMRAANYWRQAATMPGSPRQSAGLASALYAESGSHDVALQVLTAMWERTTDSNVKETLEYQMKQVVVDRDVTVLDEAVARYRQRHGRLPYRLTDLTVSGELSGVPQEPFGGEYQLNERTGAVTSSTHPERYRTNRRWQDKDIRKKTINEEQE